MSGEARHKHVWKMIAAEDGSVAVIDTFPEQYPYECECGAFTHDPETGEPCATCAPKDFERRSRRRVVSGGVVGDGSPTGAPVLCPCCGGQKHVGKPPYVAGDQHSWVANNTGGYQCPVCLGSGIIRG